MYIGKKSSRQGYWTQFETDPHLSVIKKTIHGRCIPCIENLLNQLVEGKREIKLNQAFNCWKVVAVLNDEYECLRVLEKYEQRFLSSHYLRGRFGGKEASGTQAIVINVDGEEERDALLSELEQCAKEVNPDAKVFCSRACAYLFEELLGDWREWKRITPIKYPENIEKVIERIREALS